MGGAFFAAAWRQRHPTLALLLASTAVLAPLDQGNAAQYNWSGAGGSTNWFDPNNWSPTVVPSVGDDALVDMVTPVVVETLPADIVNLFIGTTLSGEVLIQNGGSVSAVNDINVGLNADSGLTVTGAGSTASSGNAFFVGYNGAGRFDLLDGASMSSAYTSIGTFAGSSGAATVSGAGTTWSHTGYLFVGNAAQGSLTIADGAQMSGPWAHVGVGAASNGILTVTGANSRYDLSTHLYVGDGGSGTVTLAEGGTIAVGGAGTVRVADQVGSTGTVNIGAAEGATAAGAGTLDAATLTFGAGAGTLVFNHTDTSGAYAFDTLIGGLGTLKFRSGVTRLTAANSFTGTTSITGSTLLLDGSLDGSTITVGAGGRIGGTGSAGSLTLGSGGTLAAGNSIGTLSVADVTFDAGSTYEVEVTEAGQSDLTLASGAVQINGGTVHVLAAPGSYTSGTQYTILSGGSRTGTFDAVTTNYAFLTPSLSYDPTDVFLTLARNDASFTQIATSPNQASVAIAVEALGPGNPVYDAVLNQSAEGAAQAFDLLSGEAHASLRGTMIETTGSTRTIANTRLRQSFAAVSALDGRASAGDAAALPGPSHGISAWGTGFGGRSQTDGDSNTAGTRGRNAGFMFGADTMVSANWRAGLAAGYADGHHSSAGRATSSDIGSYHLLGYAGGHLGGWGVRLGLEHAWHQIDSTRSIDFPGFSEQLTGEQDARTAQGFVELSHEVALGRSVVEPFGALSLVHYRSDGFSESGGSAALTAADSDSTILFSTLGLRAMTGVDLAPGHRLTFSAGAAWRYAAGDVEPESAARFASGSTSFTVRGSPIARNALALEGGLGLQLSARASVGLRYAGQLAGDAQEHSASGHVSLQF